MSMKRAIATVASIFLGLSGAVAQQPETELAASASSALTNPPVFQGLMVDAKGKTVGRLGALGHDGYKYHHSSNKWNMGRATG